MPPGGRFTGGRLSDPGQPYNLYTHQGLPPTAIANAGKASIQAALQPDDTNYYFYVLNPDTQRHVFSRTLSEHNANLRKFG